MFPKYGSCYDNSYSKANETPAKRPPLGVKPKKCWLLDRADELKRAIKEYVDADNFEHIEVWIVQLNDINQQLKEFTRE